MSHFKQNHILESHVSKINFKIILSYMSRPSIWPLSNRFAHQNLRDNIASTPKHHIAYAFIRREDESLQIVHCRNELLALRTTQLCT